MKSWEKLKVTKLPPRNAVHSKLNMKGIGALLTCTAGLEYPGKKRP